MDPAAYSQWAQDPQSPLRGYPGALEQQRALQQQALLGQRQAAINRAGAERAAQAAQAAQLGWYGQASPFAGPVGSPVAQRPAFRRPSALPLGAAASPAALPAFARPSPGPQPFASPVGAFYPAQAGARPPFRARARPDRQGFGPLAPLAPLAQRAAPARTADHTDELLRWMAESPALARVSMESLDSQVGLGGTLYDRNLRGRANGVPDVKMRYIDRGPRGALQIKLEKKGFGDRDVLNRIREQWLTRLKLEPADKQGLVAVSPVTRNLLSPDTLQASCPSRVRDCGRLMGELWKTVALPGATHAGFKWCPQAPVDAARSLLADTDNESLIVSGKSDPSAVAAFGNRPFRLKDDFINCPSPTGWFGPRAIGFEAVETEGSEDDS